MLLRSHPSVISIPIKCHTKKLKSYGRLYNVLLSVIHTLGIGYDSITQLVLPHAAHWKEIGILLDIDSKQLEELEQTCPNDFIRCCKEMINKWLQSDRNVSQRKLFATIKLATITPLQISQTHKMLNGIDL